MKILRWVTLAGFVCSSPWTGGAQAPAQWVAVSDLHDDIQVGRVEKAVRKVSVTYSHTLLESAARDLAQRAGLELSYVSGLIPQDVRVTYRADDVSIEEAFRQVLAGTNLMAVIIPPNKVNLTQSSASKLQGTIVGKIVHTKTRQPLSGVRITLDNGRESAVTSADGTFRISAAPGEHTLSVRAVGFGRQERTITVTTGQSVAIEVVLEPSASVLDEVIVTGTVVATARKEIPTPITVITGADLEKRGITRIEQLFRGEVPGLLVLERGAEVYSTQNVGQEVSATIYSRGSANLSGGANPIKTYVDGVELLDPAYLGTIDPRSIEKIEIVTGPQAATIYGSGAMGGVMQIFTKKGSANGIPEIQVSMKYGILQNNFSSGKTPEHHDVVTMTGGAGPMFSYATSLSYDYTGQWQPKLFNRRMGVSLGATHARGPLRTSASFSTSSSRNGTWRYGLSDNLGFLYIDMAGCTTASYCSNPLGTWYYSDQVSTSSNQTMSVSADYRFTASWQQHITLGRSQNIMALIPLAPNFAETEVGADTLFQVARLSGQRTSWSYNTSYRTDVRWFSSSLTMGASGSAGDQLSVRGAQASKTSTTIIGAGTQQGPSVSLPLNSTGWGAFGQAQIGLFKQLYTTIGLRFEQNPDYGRQVKFDVTPTNGLTYTIEHGDMSLKLMGSYGRATRPPASDRRLEVVSNVAGYDIAQYISRFANPELRPEYSRGPQGGIEFYYGNWGAFTVNHYQQTITDLIQSIPVDSFLRTRLSDGQQSWVRQTQYQNVAKVRQFGWEGTGSLAFGPFTAKGAYSWSDSRVLSVHPRASSTYQPGQTFRNVPTHTGHVALGYAQGATSLSLAANYVGGQSILNQSDAFYWDIYLNRNGMYSPKASSRRSDYRNNHTTLPGYTKADLTAAHRLTAQLTAMLNVVNVGNNFRSDVVDLNPSLGRQTTLGFSYRFSAR